MLRAKAFDKWLLPYLRRRPPAHDFSKGPRHLFLAVCDHFEPMHDTDEAGAASRLETWLREWPRLCAEFRDADGRAPCHSFFFPIEQYRREHLEPLEALVKQTRAEVEVHLHHHRDTAEKMRATLAQGIVDLRRHGFLSQHPVTGKPVYAFIHGNWTLDNSSPGGANCGVPGELGLLRETGCYADLTMPSAPHFSQVRTVNSIYYAACTERPCNHDTGEPAGPATAGYRDDLKRHLLIQGPLGLNWERRKLGVMPRIENADLTGANPPTGDRLRLWQRLAIGVQGRPEWVFVKLHTHGAVERNSGMLHGEANRRFHQALAALPPQEWQVHYVSARELTNLVHAAEDGLAGAPEAARDHVYPQPPILAGR